MLEIPREIFLKDEVFGHLHISVKHMHRVARHTERNLLENKHVANFCEEARHFAILHNAQATDSLYIHYDVSSWLRDGYKVIVRIDSIAIYDTYGEYERARAKALSEATQKDSTDLN